MDNSGKGILQKAKSEKEHLGKDNADKEHLNNANYEQQKSDNWQFWKRIVRKRTDLERNIWKNKKSGKEHLKHDNYEKEKFGNSNNSEKETSEKWQL